MILFITKKKLKKIKCVSLVELDIKPPLSRGKMKRSLEEYGDFIHDESFEDLIKRIAQNREDNRASQSINHTDTDTGTLQRKPEYFSIQLQKKAKEWDTFMSKNDNFKSQKKKNLLI